MKLKLGSQPWSRNTGLFWTQILWHGVAAIILILIGSVRHGLPPWEMSQDQLVPLIMLVAAYLASASALTIVEIRRHTISVEQILLTTLALFGIVFLIFILAKINYSRLVILVTLLCAFLLILGGFRLRRFQPYLYPFLVAAGIGFSLTPQTREQLPEVVTEFIPTTYYNLEAKFYGGWIAPKDAEVRGGAITHFQDKYLLATAAGNLYVFNWSGSADTFQIEKLQNSVPINREEFVSFVEEHFFTGDFRVTDILVQDLEGRVRVFAAHHFWKNSEECFVVRVSILDTTYEDFSVNPKNLEWSVLHETTPCLPIKNYHRGHPFAGHHSGGRLLLLDNYQLLVSIGDHEFDGWNSEENLPQDLDNSYGKTILIQLVDGSSEIFTLGHRNPQGLSLDDAGNIWLTEHGPKGGDELNLLVRGENYGWPFVTLGASYESHSWPLNPNQGEHRGFKPPVFSWLPSIGISNLTELDSELFPLWNGDLMIASLESRALFRIRHGEEVLRFVEPIRIGGRIRDLLQGRDGRLILWQDRGTLTSIRPAAETVSGQALLASCTGCHEAGDGTTQGIGPDLRGIMGRKIASREDYAYSDALRRLSGDWTAERMDRFLADPQKFAPGTSMVFSGIEDSAKRAELIEYLVTLK